MFNATRSLRSRFSICRPTGSSLRWVPSLRRHCTSKLNLPITNQIYILNTVLGSIPKAVTVASARYRERFYICRPIESKFHWPYESGVKPRTSTDLIGT